MGIPGLLKVLAPLMEAQRLDSLSGKTLAIDGHAWLHRGCHSCSTDLALKRPTDGYIRFMINRIRLLRWHDIEPIVVFDGRSLPMKVG